MKIAITSGYFDPLHIGHLELLEKSKKLAGKLFVIVNNDKQAELKKGKAFMNEKERLKIVKAIKYVTNVYLSVDEDLSVCKSLENLTLLLKKEYPCAEILFTKGGDSLLSNIREKEICDKLGVHIICGLGDKIQSSRWLTKIE